MTLRKALVLVAVMGMAACSKAAPGGDDAGSTTGGGASSDGGTTKPAADGGTLTDGGTADAGTSISPKAPKVTALTARVTGRQGTDVLLNLSGTDSDLNAQTLSVRFLDVSGADVPVFDLDYDGVAESAEGPAAFPETVSGKSSFSLSAAFPNLALEHANVARVAARMRDASGNVGAVVEVALQPQPVVGLNGSCDATYVQNRCDVDLGCKGSPTTCRAPEAPQVTRAAYLRDPEGPRVLVQGADLDDDMGRVRLDYADANGNPVMLDTDNDGVPDTSTMETTLLSSPSPGTWLLKQQAAAGFDTLVQRITATPADSGDRVGAPMTMVLSDAPVRSAGQTCSDVGFDVCTAGYACMKASTTATSTTCVSLSSARSQQCTAAAGSTVMLSATRTALTGLADGASLWDPPAGCANGDPKGRPEAVAMLRVPTPPVGKTWQVGITTQLPGTTFDTVVYVYKGSASATAATSALACNDDGPGGGAGSSITLSGQAAGDYYIVVDSWGAEGGAFELQVSLTAI